MVQSNSLGLMFYRLTVHYSLPELLHDRFVDLIALRQCQPGERGMSGVSVAYEVLNSTCC